MINFAAFAPHPPILLPSVGSSEDRQKVKDTLQALSDLREEFKEADIETVIISSPHPDWGFNVPLYFLASDFQGEMKGYLAESESAEQHFAKGKEVYSQMSHDKKYALIASGDLSHCLKEDAPHGFHPEGEKFDNELIELLKNKDIANFIKLNEKYPNSANCGLPSFSFLLGILEASDISWKPRIISYEAPFGVGYLVAGFELEGNGN